MVGWTIGHCNYVVDLLHLITGYMYIINQHLQYSTCTFTHVHCILAMYTCMRGLDYENSSSDNKRMYM